MRDAQSGPPLGPSRSNGSEAGCRLSSGIRRRSKCPPPRFVGVGRSAGRLRRVPDRDSWRVSVAEPSSSTRARRGNVDVSVVIFWGDLFGSKRRSTPSKDVRSERIVAYLLYNDIRQGLIPRSAGSPGSGETRTSLGPTNRARSGRPPDTQPQPRSRQSGSEQREWYSASPARAAIVRSRDSV